MPHISIDLHEGVYDVDQRRSISDSIHQSMIDTLAIPDDDRFHFFREYPQGTIFHDDVAFGIPRTERLIFVTFSFNQRTPEVKDALYASLVRHLGALAGLEPRDVIVRIIETARENWWAEGRVVDPTTGYDERMTDLPGATV